jgi:hypothetical protein
MLFSPCTYYVYRYFYYEELEPESLNLNETV